MNILELSLMTFVNQLIFIGFRTWNVRAIAEKNMKKVLLTGSIVHIAWLIGISIGASATYEIMNSFEWKYIPVVICSLIGGLVGSYMGLIGKLKK